MLDSHIMVYSIVGLNSGNTHICGNGVLQNDKCYFIEKVIVV